MNIIKYSRVFIGVSVLLLVASCVSIARFGIPLGVDFTGGTVIEFNAQNFDATKMAAVESKLAGDAVFSEIGTTSHRLVSRAPYDTVDSVLKEIGSSTLTYTSATTVGPTLGGEMKTKAVTGLIVGLLAILLFIAVSFRHVSKPVASWKYGLMAILTLAHDVVIPLGVYAYLSSRFDIEADTLFVVALLTILAVSISDKIVVFDRIRENLKNASSSMKFADIVNASLLQTFTRSVTTSLTTVLALLMLYLFGPESTKYFSLILMIGIIVGTYSSIFVASPLLVSWNKYAAKWL